MLDELSSERRREYKEAFEMYDTKKDGTIQLSDYENVLKFLKLDPKKFQSNIHEHDINGDGTIQFEDFMTEINSKKSEKEIISREKEDDEEEIINAFKIFEKKQKGKISTIEFKDILMSEEGGNLSEEEIELLISEFDKDGYVDYIEFVKSLMQK